MLLSVGSYLKFEPNFGIIGKTYLKIYLKENTLKYCNMFANFVTYYSLIFFSKSMKQNATYILKYAVDYSKQATLYIS